MEKIAKSLLNLPTPKQVKNDIAKAIEEDKPIPLLLYKILVGESLTSKGIAASFREYSEGWQLLVSAEGREYVKRHLDALLDYVDTLSKP